MNPPIRESAATQIRPIQAADLAPLKAFLSELSPGTLYFRFGRMSVPMLTQDQWHELCEPHPERCAQFVATQITGPGRYAIVGMARLVFDAGDLNEQTRAEFSLVVADQLQNQGLGKQLMNALAGEASRRGLSSIYGDVLPSNTTMLSFCKSLGFVSQASPGDTRIHRMTLSIRGQKILDRSAPPSVQASGKAQLQAS